MTNNTNPKDIIGASKPDLALIPPVALIHQALAHKNGADKYGPYNWRENKVQMMIYLSAMQRHIIAIIDGEDVAEDSGILHLAHICAGANIVMDAMEGGNLIDNRPKKGHASEVLKRHSQVKKVKVFGQEFEEVRHFTSTEEFLRTLKTQRPDID